MCPEEPGELISVVFSSDNSLAVWMSRTAAQGPRYSHKVSRVGSVVRNSFEATGAFKRIAQQRVGTMGGKILVMEVDIVIRT